MAKLIVIRGPSGSGKSTIANFLSEGGKIPIFEADSFFMSDGKYRFDATKLAAAHEECYNNVRKALLSGSDAIVSNTNTTLREVNKYLMLKYDSAEVWRTPDPWNSIILFQRNLHKVPLETLEKQISRYTPLFFEKEWSNLEIFNGS